VVQPPRELDPALPALPLALADEAVSQRLGRVWEIAEGEPIAVTSVKPLDIKYEPGTRCVVAYGIASAEGGRETIGVIEVDQAGLRARLFDEDAALPGLAQALNMEAMRERFAAVSSGTIATASIRKCAVAPVHYKPSLSCVLRYQLATAGGERILFGKLVVAGRSHGLAATLAALEAVSRSHALMPRIPPWFGFWPDLELVVQLAVQGESLAAAIFDKGSPAAERMRLMRRGGEALGAFHKEVEATARRRTLSDDLADLGGYRSLFVHLAPHLLRTFDDAVDALASVALERGEPPAVASHGALRVGQFLLDGDDVALVDLDGFCSANPARDVGNALAYLDWTAIRRPHFAGIVEEAEDSFLAGYESVARLSDRWLTTYRAASTLKIAGRRLRSLKFDEWSLLPELLDRALSDIPRRKP
jgi:phosphotransferase family enzyme